MLPGLPALDDGCTTNLSSEITMSLSADILKDKVIPAANGSLLNRSLTILVMGAHAINLTLLVLRHVHIADEGLYITVQSCVDTASGLVAVASAIFISCKVVADSMGVVHRADGTFVGVYQNVM